MQSTNVIEMPMRPKDPSSRLRSYEAAPIPQFAIDMVHEFNRTISQELSPLRENIGGIKSDIGNLRSDLQSQGQRLGTIETNLSTVTTTYKASVKTAGWIVAGIVTLIAIAANGVQIYAYFHPHVP
jgi:hypothetical protein